MNSADSTESKRVTVTLAPGQYERLTAIAERNGATLAFIMRKAVEIFLEMPRERQIQLHFPEES
jgi:predicted DNA-binding protein